MKRTLASKIENLIEVTHQPDPPIRNTDLPLLSPYSVYHRNNTFTSSIRSLIRTRRPDVKEVVQSTRLEQCTLPATPQEQYYTIEISPDLIDQWKSQGYTHLHFGAIRLVLTLHGKKGLPVTAKVALIDSTYKKYSDALIGALLTTLSNSSVILTIQPDYNVSLFDETLLGRLKVQIQITGAEQDSQAIMATLHHQIIYRLQNHALDLSLPNSTTDALVAILNRADETSIIQIPRQIPKEELAQIMPMEWISNYEKLFHGIQTNVHTTTPPSIQNLGDGVTKTVFSKPSVSGPRPPGRILTLRPAYTPSRKSPPIAWVNQDAKPCYVSHINGHFLWDVPGSGMCDPNCECNIPEWWEDSDDEQGLYPCKYASNKAQKNKSMASSPCISHKSKKFDDEDYYGSSQPVSLLRSTRRWQSPPPPAKSSKDMSIVELMLETGHQDLVQKYFLDEASNTSSEPYVQPPTVTPQPISCIAMLNSYEQEFPPLERRVYQNTRVPSRPYVVPNTVDVQGNYQSTQVKEVLNWQTQNVVCQNTVLKRVDSKMDSLTTKANGLTYQIDQLSEEVKNLYLHQRQQANKLDAELKAFIEREYMGSQFKQKEIELKEIQQDLKRIELDMAKKQSQAIYEPYPSFSTIPAPLFPSSPTSYPEEADYSKQFKQRPPYFTPFQTFNQGSHSGSKGIHINEPTSNTSTSEPPSQEKLKQAVAPQNSQPPSYSIVTSTTSFAQTSQTITPPYTSSIGILQNSNPFTPLQDPSDSEESQTDSSSQDYSDTSSEAEITDISRIAMIRPGEDEEFVESHVEHPDDNPPRQDHNYKPTSGPWFSFDDLPYEEWRSRLQEFSDWIDLQITAQQIPLRQALQEFVSRFTGTLREWFQNMSPYQKLQAVQVEDAVILLDAIRGGNRPGQARLRP
ncbi:hypothetical protein K1719_023375 [Acacia pycnantha]|nr:hypothetical protein K1719_023375 [Acacia pycnantha]